MLSLFISACSVQFLYAYGGGGEGSGVSLQTGGDTDSPPDNYEPTTGPITVCVQEGSTFRETTKPARPARSPEYTSMSQNDQETLDSIFQDLDDGRSQLQNQQAPVKHQTVSVQEGNTFVSRTIAVPQKHPGLIKIERALNLLASNPQLLNAFTAESNRRQRIDEMDRRDAVRQLRADYQRMQDDENATRVQLIKYGGRFLIGNNLGLGLLYSLSWTAAEAPGNLTQRQFNQRMDRTVAIEIGKKVAREVLFK